MKWRLKKKIERINEKTVFLKINRIIKLRIKKGIAQKYQ
jgi:hypothetical protein